MKYKPGDRVIIKNRKQLINSSFIEAKSCIAKDPYAIVPDMYPFLGETVTIEKVGRDYYEIEEEQDKYFWREDIILGFAEDTPDIIKLTELALRLQGVQYGSSEIKKIVNTYELIKEKGDVTLKDILTLDDKRESG